MSTENKSGDKKPDKLFFDQSRVEAGFIYRVWFTIGAVILAGLLLILLWQGTEVILLVFGGLLLAVFLDSVSSWISEKISLSKNWSLAMVLLILAGLTVFGGWFFLTSLQAQFAELLEKLPQAVGQIREYLSQSDIGRRILEQMPTMQDINRQSSNLFGRITGYFSTFLGMLVNVLVVISVGIYFAFNPNTYYRGILRLIPDSRQQRAEEILDVIGFTLGRWLIGRLTVMTINGCVTALGLWLLGVPLPIPLGILTALLNFVPNIGPVIASVPAILLALMQSPATALYVAIFYLLLQGLEGYILTPIIQKRAISIPPVLVISAQLFLGILFGFLGVLLAVPLLAVFSVLVRMIYIEDVLGREVEFEGLERAEADIGE